MICYSCHDQMMFQFHGMTDKYNPVEQSAKYIEEFKKGNTRIDCEACGRIVDYIQDDNGKWKEIGVDLSKEGNK